MKHWTVSFRPDQISVTVPEGTTLLQAQILAGLRPDAPCGGRGTCGKCVVTLADGTRVPACRTPVVGDMTVTLPRASAGQILTEGAYAAVHPDGEAAYSMAFDIGTTTVVACLRSGITGELLAQASCVNPQSQYGADVISRLQYAMKEGTEPLSGCIRQALAELTRKACGEYGICPEEVTVSALVGNTAMHHLLLDIDPKPLVTPPYMPAEKAAREMDASGILPVSGKLRVLPNIAGFVGGDTVGCMVAAQFDKVEELTLLIDIGTNGEMVLGNRERRIACSTAAGPAFEGAKISCGMRGAVGAVDHVTLEKGKIRHHVIGGGEAEGLCGSGLLDLVAVLLDLGIISETGRMEGKVYSLTENVVLTQKDVREVQLAKAAIRVGIELLAEQMDVQVGDIRWVLLAGAFGNYMDPASACRIGMIPPVLLDRVEPIGNAAAAGAGMCGLSRAQFDYSSRLAETTEFLELATLPEFQTRYIDALNFPEEEDT